MATRKPLASIPTPTTLAIAKGFGEEFSRAVSRARRGYSFVFRACAILLALCLILPGPLDLSAQAPKHKKKKSHKPQAIPCRIGCNPDTPKPEIATDTPEDAAAQKELAELARALHAATPGAYEKLSAFAVKNTTTMWGARAALALGYDDYNKNRAAQALGWLIKAQNDTLLREYALFWGAQAKHSLKRIADAYQDLQTIQREYPNSAMREQLLESLAPYATELGRPQEALDALNAYSATPAKPTLLLERAHALQSLHQLVRAAKDYQILFYKNSQTDEAQAAGSALSQIMHALGKEYPYPGAELQEQRAQAFFDAHKWKEARSEFEKLLTMLRDPANPTRQRAQLRVAESRVQLKGSPSLISSLKTPDPEVDAERLYAVSQAERTAKREKEMFTALEQLAQKYPQSKWNEDGLMAAGNYYWVELDRNRAVSYYEKMLEVFPDGKNTFNAEWRIAWVTYLNRQPDSDARLSAFLVKYPASANAVDALYWLGRNAERAGNSATARAYYSKAVERFPQTYFGRAAALRLTKLGPGEGDPVALLDKIPAAPALRSFDEPIPAAASDRWARAQALRSIAFDASAEQELKNAFFATGSPRFLLEAAQAAFDQGHFGAGIAYARVIVPNFDARKFDELPVNVWKALYPLPYEAAVRREAAKNDFDPMLAAGLMRQESTFQADAVSYANAIGLMQVLPKTGKILAKQIKVRYSRDKLFEPDYNLELGMVYIAGLLRATGAPEYALAAFNAGEDRIAAWRAERNYEEIPELVESIPFTQTREYVQIVLRNAEVYRMIYGQAGVATQTAGTARAR
ncbi:MAG TPA: transglycosylase SLT domain-containing protein [Candidatus Acidoferrum sp.]|jgi:soluble lytic murein transglycosylase|nr:transglycosylase SLT domain-containing protein [Candidatus Acidoferrum sp.]